MDAWALSIDLAHIVSTASLVDTQVKGVRNNFHLWYPNHPFPVKVKQVKMEVKSVGNTVAIAILKTIGGEVSHSDASPTSVNPSGFGEL